MYDLKVSNVNAKKIKTKRSPKKKICRRNRVLLLDSIIFFACTYLYVLLFIEPRLIFHSFGTFTAYPTFSVDWGFFKNSISYQGGIIEYVGGFISQLYYFSWLGALIVTAIALLMYLATKILIKLSAGVGLKLICYIPVVILLMIYNRYDNQATSFVALLAVLWFSVVYEIMAMRNSFTCVLVFLFMFALLYYIAAGACFVFAILATIYEFFIGQRRILGVLFLTAVIGFYLMFRYIFNLEADITHLQVLVATLKSDPWIKILLFCLYFFFPLTLFGAGLRQALVRKNDTIEHSKMHTHDKSRSVRKPRWNIKKNKAKWAIGIAFPTVILVVSVFVTFDSTKKKIVQVDYFAHNGMWPEVLQTAHRIRPESYDIFCIHDINRALYHTGRLGDDMFRYPQKLQALILSVPEARKPSGRIFLKRSRSLSQFGHIGIAERDAFEFMNLTGSSPAILEHLATIKMVKGQVEAAKVFLKALSKDLIFGNRGREMLQRLEQDPELANDKLVQHMRSVALDKDNVSFDFGVGEFFQQLLDKNPDNKLAFEYLMAIYLLTGQVDQIVANIGRLNYLGYDRIPQCYEEAILIHIGLGHTKINLHGWKLKPETISRIKEIDRIYKLHGGRHNEQGVKNSLGADFADSYFLYFLYDLSGARR